MPNIISTAAVLVIQVVKTLATTVFGLNAGSNLQRSAIFLFLFVIIHCSGNLLIFKGDKGDRFNAYGYILRSNPLIIGIELYLFVGSVVHALAAIYIGIRDK
eukprot:gene15770-4760_t